MIESITGNAFLVLGVLVFVAVLLLLEGLYLFWRAQKGPQAKKLNKRLQALSASHDRSAQAQILKQRMIGELPPFERFLSNLPRAHQIDKFILQAGLEWSVSKMLLLSSGIGVAGGFLVVALAHQTLLWGLLGGLVLATLPWLHVQRKRQRRLIRLEQQLPEALDLLTRALRAGHAFSAGLQMVGDEMAEPIANEFRIVHDEVNFGVSLQQALTNLSERIPLTDLRYFVVAVLIQRDSGGNLTEILGNLSRLIRERLKLISKVRVLSAEGRLSAWILGVMPFALAGILYLGNPKFMSPLWIDPIGRSMVKYMLIFMVLGILVLKKIVKIRV